MIVMVTGISPACSSTISRILRTVSSLMRGYGTSSAISFTFLSRMPSSGTISSAESSGVIGDS